MAKYFFQVKSTKPNMQAPLTQIANWVKETPAAPWSAIVTQPSNLAIAVQVTCDQTTRDALEVVMKAAVKYADGHYSASNTTCIAELADAFPNPMDPACLEYLNAENG